MDSLILSCPITEVQGIDYIRIDQFRGFVHNLRICIQHQDSSLLFKKRGLKLPHVANIIEFIDGEEYLNIKSAVRPAIKRELVKIFESGEYYIEILLTGGIGIGKGFLANIGLAYCLYLNSVLHSPQIEYGLAPGSSIYFIIQSKTETLARKAVFNEFIELIKASPYFQNQFPFDKSITSELRFPNNIYVTPFGGSDTACLGLNVVGGILDELNFMARVEDSTTMRFHNNTEYDQAERIYGTITRRMKSRFQTFGRLPGKVFLLSSVNYPGDFTDRKAKEAEHDKTIYVMKMAIWESIPESRLSKERFTVEIGDEYSQSRIIEDGLVARPDSVTIEVPVDYKRDFEKDIEGALRDLAGIAVSTKFPFIPYREEMAALMSEADALTNNRSLFLHEEININAFPDFERIVNLDYIQNCIMNQEQPFAFHLDVGTGGDGKNDAAGLSVGHIAGYKLLPSTKIWNQNQNDFVEVRDIRAPIYHIDGALRIKARRGEEIDLERVRDMILWLRQYVFLKWGTCDSYQHILFLQAFKRAQIRAGTLSVDTDLGPYAEVKTSIKEGRILFHSRILARELRELEYMDGKIDHPVDGTKDVSDSTAGVVFILQNKEARYGKTSALSRRHSGQQSRRVTQHLNRGVRRIKI